MTRCKQGQGLPLLKTLPLPWPPRPYWIQPVFPLLSPLLLLSSSLSSVLNMSSSFPPQGLCTCCSPACKSFPQDLCTTSLPRLAGLSSNVTSSERPAPHLPTPGTLRNMSLAYLFQSPWNNRNSYALCLCSTRGGRLTFAYCSAPCLFIYRCICR